ncbi:hypothetical protein L083_5903 [Actinoplanes sp. N902-109]|nr:hypothetical protein L083_5903 [Actinoplanes sp. N902-109]
MQPSYGFSAAGGLSSLRGGNGRAHPLGRALGCGSWSAETPSPR